MAVQTRQLLPLAVTFIHPKKPAPNGSPFFRIAFLTIIIVTQCLILKNKESLPPSLLIGAEFRPQLRIIIGRPSFAYFYFTFIIMIIMIIVMITECDVSVSKLLGFETSLLFSSMGRTYSADGKIIFRWWEEHIPPMGRTYSANGKNIIPLMRRTYSADGKKSKIRR